MPRIARTFIKTGLVFFLISLLLGIAVEVESIASPVLMPLFWHTLMVGWITQIIFGVSMWMFPGRTKKEEFKAQLWGWLTYIFLNVGLTLRLVAEPMLPYSNLTLWNVLVLCSAILQVSGGVTYLIEMWPRIMSKEQRRRRRKKKGKQQ